MTPPRQPPDDDPLYDASGQRRPLTRGERMIGVRHMILASLIVLALLFTVALCGLPR
ncbi:MAG TPA: hypothetical protein VIG69_07980 [Candidatus Methylomirabilis sp.]